VVVVMSANLTQLRPALPLRPRFIREAVLAPFENGFVVDGTDRLCSLAGGAARNILPALIPLMDGTRELPELENALEGVPATRVREAITVLFGSGLLEDATGECPAETDGTPATVAFFRRFLRATGANRNARHAYQKLADVTVIVAAAPDHLPPRDARAGAILRSLLEDAGCRMVRLLTRNSANELDPIAARQSCPTVVVSFCAQGEDCDWHTELDAWCARHKFPWLRTVVDEEQGYADIGPIFQPPESACYRCFRAVQAKPGARRVPSVRSKTDGSVEFWASLTVVEMAYWLTRMGPRMPARGFRRYRLPSCEATDLLYPRLPGCPRCRPCRHSAAKTGQSGWVPTAMVFEDYVERQPSSTIDPTADEALSRLGSQLIRQSKSLPICKRYPFDGTPSDLDGGVGEALRAPSYPSAGCLTVQAAATIMATAAGIRSISPEGTQVRRWAATGGNLGSVELFLVARAVEGLPPGVYFYQSHEKSLASLERHSDGLDVTDLMARIMPEIPDGACDALVIFTGAYHRLVRKYGPFAYRLMLMDAGVAMTQMHLAANCLGMRSPCAVHWSDDLIEERLGLDFPNEQVTGVVGVSSLASGAPRITRGYAWPSTPPDAAPLVRTSGRDFHDASVADVLERLRAESRMNGHRIARNSAVFAEPVDDGAGTVHPLPPPAIGSRPVGAVLAGRKTHRTFKEDPISREQLSTILSGAQQNRSENPAEAEQEDPSQLIRLLVLAWKVHGLDRAAYWYGPAEHTLRFSRALPSVEASRDLLAQSDFGFAPVQVWITGDLFTACARYGAVGHRSLLVRSGAMANRLWLSAMGAGLAGAIVAGIVPAMANPLLGLDGFQNAAVVMFAVGHAVSQPVTPGPT
jgi:SagB-type dehydrogenase family enzyme